MIVRSVAVLAISRSRNHCGIAKKRTGRRTWKKRNKIKMEKEEAWVKTEYIYIC